MDDTSFLAFSVFFLISRFSICLYCSSDSVIFLAMFLPRRYVPCLVANFAEPSIGIKPTHLHFITKSSLTLRCSVISSKFLMIFNASQPCSFQRTLKILLWPYNFITKTVLSSFLSSFLITLLTLRRCTLDFILTRSS